MIEDQPIRFYAVSYGRHGDYCEYYILATSPEDALRQFLRSEYPFYSVVGTVWEADFDDNGLIRKSKELYEIELPGKNGYLWAKTGLKDVDEIDEKHGIIRCLLCGCGPLNDPPTEEDKKFFLNENGKCVDCAKYKIFKP